MAEEWLQIMQDVSDGDGASKTAAEGAPPSRQERIRRAFDDSKASYQTELVVLSPSWFRIRPEDVLTTIKDDRFGLQNLDSSITDAYVHKDYRLALDLCLAYLDGTRDAAIPIEAASSRDREYYDIALKSCLRLKDTLTGTSLAKRSEHLWKAHSAVGTSAALIYLMADDPRQSISTLLASIPMRANAHPHLQLLAQSFSAWYTQIAPSGSSPHLTAIASIRDILTSYAARTAIPFYYGVSSKSRPADPEDLDQTFTPQQIRSFCADAGFVDEELELLAGLCTAKLSDADDGDGGGGKSVRAL